MLNKLKQYWGYVVAGAIALAYLIGIKKGKEHEKAHQTDTLLAHVESGNRARHRLNTDSAVRDQLHKKYRRK